MSLAFARMRFIGRRSGGNAVRSAAYNERTNLVDERTGERFDFGQKQDKPVHHEVMLPDGADPRFINPAYLWNAAEKAERRSDSIVAKELVLALPAENDVSPADRIALAQSFVKEHFVNFGLAVQIDVHLPHDIPGAEPAERGNVHCHALISTRRVEGDRFADRKARELDPVVRAYDGRSFVAAADRWGELWRGHQQKYFEQHRINTIVDPLAIHPGRHSFGPKRRHGRAIDALIHEHRARNTEAARDPERVFEHLRRAQQKFDQRALDRFIETHLPKAERAGVREAVLQRAERDRLTETAERLRKALEKVELVGGKHRIELVRAQEHLAARDRQIGAGRRILHASGAWTDLETEKWEKWQARSERGINRWSLREKTILDQLATVEEQLKGDQGVQSQNADDNNNQRAAAEALRREQAILSSRTDPARVQQELANLNERRKSVERDQGRQNDRSGGRSR